MDIKLFSDVWKDDPRILEGLVNQAKSDRGTIFVKTTRDWKIWIQRLILKQY
jgi:hypothetical protein